MSSNFEFQLLGKILETGDFETVVKSGITDEFFFSDEIRAAFKFLWDHYHHPNTHRSIPSWEYLKHRFQSLTFVRSNDTLPSLCEYVKQNKLRDQIHWYASRMQQQADTDPREALGTLKEAAANLSIQHERSNDLTLASAHDLLRKEYEEVVANRGVTGISWPWEILNEDTRGIHPGDFIIIYGRPKSQKTWLSLAVCMHAYMHDMARVLIYSLEMKPLHILRRCAALLSKIDYKKFSTGRLPQHDVDRVFSNLKYLELEEKAATASGLRCSAIKVVGKSAQNRDSSGVTALQAKIEEFKPTLVLVDGMYLMRDDRTKTKSVDWKYIANVAQDLASTAQIYNIPIIATNQANREAVKNKNNADMSEMSFTDVVAQECTLAIRVTLHKDSASDGPELHLHIPGGREGCLDGFITYGIPAINFSYKRPLKTEQDDDSPHKPPKNGKMAPPSGLVPNIIGHFHRPQQQA